MGQGDRMQLPNPEEEAAQLGRFANVTESSGAAAGDSATGDSATGATGAPTGGASGQPASKDENLDDEEVVPS